jgi:ribosomal protection tetracycline resistance protein
MKIVNIGILAHVDAGKTTITENLLFHSGIIKEAGRVDLGNTQTDSMELERRRGISIKASATSFTWNDIKINLIDTPGHVDFISEVERSLNVLDGAILVISAVEGIQSQTRILFNTLKALKIPTIIFINKLDRLGADSNKLINEIRKTMTKEIISLQKVYGEGSKDIILDDLFKSDILNDDMINVLSDIDDSFLEAYVKDMNLDKCDIKKKIVFHSKQGSLYPVLFGAASLGIGIKELLNGITQYFPTYDGDSSEDLSGVVFKIERTDNNEKKVYVRLFQGKVCVRDIISVSNKDITEKIKKINTLKNGKLIDESSICAGDIGIIYGTKSLQIGDIIGLPSSRIRNASIVNPAFVTTISAVDIEKTDALFQALTILSEEDPFLELETDNQGHMYINLFGEIQMEILSSILEDLYNIKVEFSNTQTIYKETPKGVGTATMYMRREFNPFWATVGLKIEPDTRGAGLSYISNVSTGSLPKSFQNAIEEAVISTSKQGLFGLEVTDAKVTLIFGEFSSPVSTPADFRNVTPMVFMEALNEAKTQLLEPVSEFELRIPKSVISKAMWDLETMRATYNEPVIIEDEMLIKGFIPVDNSKEYKLKIAAYTEGKGTFITKFYGYKEVPFELAKTREKTTWDPLNKKEYLLYKLNVIRD